MYNESKGIKIMFDGELMGTCTMVQIDSNVDYLGGLYEIGTIITHDPIQKILKITDFVPYEKPIEKPKKAVVTKKQADWLDKNTEPCNYYNKTRTLFRAYEGYFKHNSKAFNLSLHEETNLLLQAIDNGYEVEKEPLFYIKIANIGSCYIGLSKLTGEQLTIHGSQLSSVKSTFTEEEIRELNPDYLPFKVPVNK